MSELLTRLNPKTFRMTPGSGGGRSEFTDQDIAAALGMVKNKLGADLLMRMHCPGLVDWQKLDADVLLLVKREHDRRQDDRTNAEIAALIRRQAVRPSAVPVWPAFSGREARYWALARGVVQEIISGDVCVVCKGRQRVTLMASGEVITCGHCAGTGVEPEPIRQRSRRMGVRHSRFVETWAEPYRWAYSEAVEASMEASRQFSAALGRRAA